MANDIPLMRPYVSQRSKELSQEVLSDRWIGCGDWTMEFEDRVAEKLLVPNFFATSSGTVALQIAYEMAHILPDDEIITTPLTCLATHVPLIKLGARLVWADIKPNGTVDVQDISRKITKNTKAIVIVDYAGTPCDLDEINRVAALYDCIVIEDAAQAFATTYKGRPLGAHCDFVCFSFQATKIITTVDGGGFVVRDGSRYDEARRMRWLGIDRHNRIVGDQNVRVPGLRAEMNNVSAVIGIGNLTKLGDLLAHRRWLKRFYASKLATVSGVTLLDLDGEGESNSWAFSIWAADRDNLARKLRTYGIEAGQLHHRTDKVDLIRASSTPADLPVMDQWEKSALCLPIGYWVSADDAERIVSAISSGW
jgi:dTDP-4-amino-4,6-dideoxygalactose transaminase